MKIQIIAAALPPQLDGIGDYTANLSVELAKSADVTVLTCEGIAPTPIPGVQIESVFSFEYPASVRRIVKVVAQDNPDWVLLQYNPFSYGRWGLNLHLPSAMSALKRRSPGTRFALMIHERFVPVVNVKFAVMATWQRWQFVRLGRCADLVFFSTSGWAREFASRYPGKPVMHLPVGSNIPRMLISRDEARGRLGIGPQTVVLGLFGTAHVSRLLPWARHAAEAVRDTGRDVLVLYIGPHGKEVRHALGDIPALTEGPLPSEEISRRFAALDIYLVPLIDGVSTRRTTLMTGLQHGIATVGTRGPLTDAMLASQDGRAFLLADVRSPDAFRAHVLRLVEDEALRSALGREAQQLYEREFSWPQVAARLFAGMTN